VDTSRPQEFLAIKEELYRALFADQGALGRAPQPRAREVFLRARPFFEIAAAAAPPAGEGGRSPAPSPPPERGDGPASGRRPSSAHAHEAADGPAAGRAFARLGGSSRRGPPGEPAGDAANAGGEQRRNPHVRIPPPPFPVLTGRVSSLSSY
jgi:hypothetical protein